MIPIILWSVAAILCGAVALVLAFIAVRRHSKHTLQFALLFALLAIGSGGIAVFAFASRSYARVSNMFTPRTGMEIYTALLGKPADCVEVTAHRDQVVPKLDTGISLRMRTCPAEMRRLLQAGPYQLERSAAGAAHRLIGGSDAAGSFAPEELGDTVLTFYWELDPGRNWRWIYMNPDSTEAICVDILD